MRITTKGRYAIRAITNLAMSNPEKPKPIKTIAEEEGISPEFLEQIFFRLKKTGMISSVRGPGGGFKLARDPQEVSVKEIFTAVGEGIDLTPCTTMCEEDDKLSQNPNAYTASGCDRTAECLVHDIWQQASNHINQYFEQMTLDKILKSVDADKLESVLPQQ